MKPRSSLRAGLLAPVMVAVLAGAGTGIVATVVSTSPASATTFGPVNPALADGATNSLRDILENQIAAGDTVNLQAGATYQLTDCSDTDIDVQSAVTINGNGATIQSTCPNNGEAVLETSDALTLNSVTLTGGSSTSEGGAIQDFGGALIINHSAIVGNTSCDDGGGVYHGGGGPTTITYSTIANNIAGGFGGGIHTDNVSPVVITDSTISNNTARQAGGIDADNHVSLIYTTLVDNTQGSVSLVCGDSAGAKDKDAKDKHPASTAGNVHAQAAVSGANLNLEPLGGASQVSIFGTVIALPHGGTNCASGASVPIPNTTSAGYNYSDDMSCGLTSSTDKQQGADPQLAGLAANGGIGQTRLPALTSPLVDAIPVSSCAGGNTLAGFGVTTDERGVTRPQGAGCEIGAVEIVPPVAIVVVQPRFTG